MMCMYIKINLFVKYLKKTKIDKMKNLFYFIMSIIRKNMFLL